MDLDDLNETNKELAQAVTQNTRRYSNMVSDAVYEMLPDYKHREVIIISFNILCFNKLVKYVMFHILKKSA